MCKINKQQGYIALHRETELLFCRVPALYTWNYDSIVSQLHFSENKAKFYILVHVFLLIWSFIFRWIPINQIAWSKIGMSLENRLVDRVEEGENGMDWESSIETYVTLCKIDSQREFVLWCRDLKPVLCDHLEEWNGWDVWVKGGHVYTYGWLIVMCGRNQHKVGL